MNDTEELKNRVELLEKKVNDIFNKISNARERAGLDFLSREEMLSSTSKPSNTVSSVSRDSSSNICKNPVLMSEVEEGIINAEALIINDFKLYKDVEKLDSIIIDNTPFSVKDITDLLFDFMHSQSKYCVLDDAIFKDLSKNCSDTLGKNIRENIKTQIIENLYVHNETKELTSRFIPVELMNLEPILKEKYALEYDGCGNWINRVELASNIISYYLREVDDKKVIINHLDDALISDLYDTAKSVFNESKLSELGSMYNIFYVPLCKNSLDESILVNGTTIKSEVHNIIKSVIEEWMF